MESFKLENIDFNKIGIKCGLEIHQQLDTKKLFCRCDSKVKSEKTPDSKISRKLSAVKSESGSDDITAELEKLKDKEFIYHFYNDCNCLVETDSQPPFPVNRDSLKIALTIAKLTNSKLVDKSYVMRKQVVNGSNVSGFQRTMMICTDGFLEFDFGKVRIDKLLLEEDSARKIKTENNKVEYSLDRLGIPLIELVAWHDIKTPEDVKKVAKKIGEIFRITGKVKRGLGSVRQDINISIENGARVEIKGSQDLDGMVVTVKKEAQRQLNLLKVKDELIKREVKDIDISFKDISNIFSNTKSKVILNNFKGSKKVYAFKLEKFKDILGFEIQENKRVATELSNILKKNLDIKGLFHLDELPNYGISINEVNEVIKILNLSNNDSFIIIVCKDNKLKYIKKLLEQRINLLRKEIPTETRMVDINFNTEYQRPLSSSSRMYPETDLKEVVFDKKILDEVEKEKPYSLDKRLEIYKNKFNLSSQLSEKMKLNNLAPLFYEISINSELNPTTIAVFLLEDLITLKRDKKLDLENLDKADIYNFLVNKKIKEIPKKKLSDAFIYYLKVKDLDKTINDLSLNTQDIDLDKIIDDITTEYKDEILSKKQRAIGLLMGRVMAKTKGLVDGKEVSLKLKQKIEKMI